MKQVGIVGLGLIGGSMAKAVKAYTDAQVYGNDADSDTLLKAMQEGVINESLTDENLKKCDFVIVALYPQACIEFLQKKASLFSKGAIVVDCTGVKEEVCSKVSEPLHEAGVHFIGGHPMAGIERSGYENSFAKLFRNATMILCKDRFTQEQAFQDASEFFLQLGFSEIKETTSKEHDQVIAYTSQMAHIVSSAYIKSDTLKLRYGFSAGSFKDLTRVARLKEDMWTQLFLDNKDALLRELDTFLVNIQAYRNALANEDSTELTELLRDGRIRKTTDENEEERRNGK